MPTAPSHFRLIIQSFLQAVHTHPFFLSSRHSVHPQAPRIVPPAPLLALPLFSPPASPNIITPLFNPLSPAPLFVPFVAPHKPSRSRHPVALFPCLIRPQFPVASSGGGVPDAGQRGQDDAFPSPPVHSHPSPCLLPLPAPTLAPRCYRSPAVVVGYLIRAKGVKMTHAMNNTPPTMSPSLLFHPPRLQVASSGGGVPDAGQGGPDTNPADAATAPPFAGMPPLAPVPFPPIPGMPGGGLPFAFPGMGAGAGGNPPEGFVFGAGGEANRGGAGQGGNGGGGQRLLSDAAQLVSSQSGPVTVTSSVGSSSPHATARMLYVRFPEIRNDDRDHAHYLDPQNRARAEVGSPALVWDAELQAQAERLAEYLAQKEGCAVRRMKEISGGVNLRWAAESWGVPAEAESTVAEWVREKAHYRLEAFPAGCAEGRDCTHYTQVVWKKTERVGCGTAMCNEGGAIWACRYFPPGNIEGNRPY
ncbi:unnamed protein product [Closterium sp. Naga37s-1]|nr:unnamed protein product [Closterium sp. Naga37s-1]